MKSLKIIIIIPDHNNHYTLLQKKKESLKIIIIIWDHNNHYTLLQKNEIIKEHYNNLGSQKSLLIITKE